jgi:MOSC domain-containing protein YiiM
MIMRKVGSDPLQRMADGTAPFVEAVFVGGPKVMTDEQGSWTSSIGRARVSGPVRVEDRGIEGDRVAHSYHGSPDAAICVHLADHYRFWKQTVGIDLRPGAVGENLTLCGLGEGEICVGDVVRIGTAVLQVSGPRVPCAHLARHIGRKDWVKLTIRENRTGFYMRVLEPGRLSAGDRWELEERLNGDASISAVNGCMYLDFDPDFARRMIAMRGLGDWWKQQAAEKLRTTDMHWTAGMRNDATE